MKNTILQKVESWLKEVLPEAGSVSFVENISFGDITTNAALAIAAREKRKPLDVAKEIAQKLRVEKPDFISDISVAGPGFINFTLSDPFLLSQIKHTNILENVGMLSGKKVIVEYTDPNPFKEFHIGHLMSNAVGEAISRLVASQGAEVKRACYQGDVGLHVAKAVWGKIQDQALSWGEAYVFGEREYENNKEAIQIINKAIYERSDEKVNTLYDAGRKTSLEYFDDMYEKLGTKFNYLFFESETAPIGTALVKEFLGKVFEESDGAIVFHGEKYDPALHTRVFISSQGLPTYEAKELGLAKLKWDKNPYDASIVVTGNEVNDYFKVVLKASELVMPELAGKTVHISHGMLRLPSGKMSSRTGDVISAESLIKEVKEKALEVMKASGRAGEDEALAEKVAVGAIKFSILKQSPGKDVIFDMNRSVSFEGDSGPYLMYTHARLCSVIEKARAEGIEPAADIVPAQGRDVARIIARFPDVVARAAEEFAPNHIVEYLLVLASTVNSYYAKEQIVVAGDAGSPARLGLIFAARETLSKGLSLLAMAAPEKM